MILTGGETFQPVNAVFQWMRPPMSEEYFLRYRLEVVRLMPEGPYKNVLITTISASLAALRARQVSAR
jgi:hypothetical protein